MSASVLPALHLSAVEVWFGNHHVLHGIDLTAQPGRRIGVVGENGSGKSTLLHAIAGTLPDHAVVEGSIVRPPEVVMLAQQPAFGRARTVAEALAEALAPAQRMMDEVERLAAAVAAATDPSMGAAYADAIDRAVAHEAWDSARRAQEAAELLGIGALRPDREITTLSGGQQSRLALAALLTTRPTCLLLDEPTNHLDDDAIEVLTSFLRSLPGVVLFASHDRVLLDEVCTDLLDLDPSEFGTDGRGGRRFGGGWTAYEQHRAAARRRWEATYAAQQEELARLREEVQVGATAVAQNRPARDNDKFIYHRKGENVARTVARRKRDAQRRLDLAERQQVSKPRARLRLRSELTGAGTVGSLVHVRDLEVPGRLRLDRLDVATGEHLLVSGANGSGKTSLLGVLTGRVRPSGGTVLVRARRVVELAQDVHFSKPELSAQATYDSLVGIEHAPRTTLRELGLLPPDRLTTPVALLSVGQRRRLALAIAIAGAPDLLLLDEPTNHLSMALAGEIEDALQTTPGTVVVATHDRWLRRRWDGRELRLEIARELSS
jgi:macrolide transport system ATP-binding/permease protein